MSKLKFTTKDLATEIEEAFRRLSCAIRDAQEPLDEFAIEYESKGKNSGLFFHYYKGKRGLLDNPSPLCNNITKAK